MTTVLSIDSTAWVGAAPHLAGLAAHFTPVASGSADVVVIAGSNAEWPAAALGALGRTAVVLVVDPRAVAPDSLRLLAARAAESGSSVILCDPWAHSVASDLAAGEWSESMLGHIVLIDIDASLDRATTAPDASIIRPLYALYSALNLLPRLVAIQTSGDATIAAGRIQPVAPGREPAPVLLRSTGVGTRSSSCTITVLLDDGALEWVLPGDGTAAPSTLTSAGPSGVLLHPTSYESPYRRALRSAYAAAATRTGATETLTNFIALLDHVGAELDALAHAARTDRT